MKLLSLALLASLAVAGYAYAQTATPAAAPAPAASSSPSAPSHDCKKEVKKLCGRTHNQQETQDCIKSNLDLNKFSAECKTELSKPKS